MHIKTLSTGTGFLPISECHGHVCVLPLSTRGPKKIPNYSYTTCKTEVPDTAWCSWLQLGTLLEPFSKGERVLPGV